MNVQDYINRAPAGATEMPCLNFEDWTILDYELAFDGFRHLADACLWLENQPRAHKGTLYRPGADFIASLHEGWLNEQIDKIIDRLSVIRFDDPDSEDRRLRLLIMFHADFGTRGEIVKEVVDLIMRQVLPKAGGAAHAA